MEGFSLCSRAKVRWGILTGSRVLNRIYNAWNVLCQVNEILLIHKKGSVNCTIFYLYIERNSF